LEIIARVKDRAIGSAAESFIKKSEVGRTTVQCAICERYQFPKANHPIERKVNDTPEMARQVIDIDGLDGWGVSDTPSVACNQQRAKKRPEQ
jgi:hypothetical protein